MPPTKKRQQLQSFEDTETCTDFIFKLFETTDVVDRDDFGVLLSLMLKRTLSAEEISNAQDQFYQLYHENESG